MVVHYQYSKASEKVCTLSLFGSRIANLLNTLIECLSAVTSNETNMSREMTILIFKKENNLCNI